MRHLPRLSCVACACIAILLASCGAKKTNSPQKNIPPTRTTSVSVPAVKEPDASIDSGLEATKATTDPIRFSTKGIGVYVTKRKTDASIVTKSVPTSAANCTSQYPLTAHTELTKTYAKAQALSYVLSTVRTPTHYVVTVLPNLSHAKDLAAAQKMFPWCNASGGFEVIHVSPAWIVFHTPCSTKDGVCQLLSKKVDTSLVIK